MRMNRLMAVIGLVTLWIVNAPVATPLAVCHASGQPAPSLLAEPTVANAPAADASTDPPPSKVIVEHFAKLVSEVVHSKKEADRNVADLAAVGEAIARETKKLVGETIAATSETPVEVKTVIPPKDDPIPAPPGPVTPEYPKASFVASSLTASKGQFVGFDGTAAIGDKIIWKTAPPCDFEMTSDNGRKFAVAAKPPFDVIQVVTKGGEVDVAVIQIALDKPEPPPTPPVPPGPGPGPAPTPTPTATKLYVYVWQDPKSITQTQSKVINDPTWQKALTDKGHTWRRESVNDGEDERTNLRKKLDELGTLPAVTVQNAETGELLAIFSLPSSAQTLANEVLKYGAK